MSNDFFSVVHTIQPEFVLPVDFEKLRIGQIVKLSADTKIHGIETAGIEPYAVVIAANPDDSIIHIPTITVALIGPFTGLFVEGDHLAESDGKFEHWVVRTALTATIPFSALLGRVDGSIPLRVLNPESPEDYEIPDGIIYSDAAAEQILNLYTDLEPFADDLQRRKSFYLTMLEQTAEFLPTLDEPTEDGVADIGKLVEKQLALAFTERAKWLIAEKQAPIEQVAHAASDLFSYEEFAGIATQWKGWESLRSALLLVCLAETGMYLKSGTLADRTVAEHSLSRYLSDKN